MKPEETRPLSLREIELEVQAEGREWTRRRLQQRLQEEAEQRGEVFPPQRSAVGASAPTADATAHRGGNDGTAGAPRPRSVPTTEVQLAFGDGNHYFLSYDLTFEMGICVVLTCPVRNQEPLIPPLSQSVHHSTPQNRVDPLSMILDGGSL